MEEGSGLLMIGILSAGYGNLFEEDGGVEGRRRRRRGVV